MKPMVLPVPAHVHALLSVMGRHGLIHGEGHGAERLLVHCEAGLGRAPAMAIVALMSLGIDAMAAVEAVAMAGPEASPNRLVLRHAKGIMGQAIIPHAQLAWTYRRGPAGAQGEAVGLRVVGGGHAGPPLQDEIPQAEPGAGPRLGQPENGVPTSLGETPGGLAAVSTHPNLSGIPHRSAASPGRVPSGETLSLNGIGSGDSILPVNGLALSSIDPHAPEIWTENSANAHAAENAAGDGDPGPKGGDRGGDPGPHGDQP